MQRMRLILGSLLPAVWLLASGYAGVDTLSGYAGGCCVVSILSAQAGQRLPVPGSCAFDESARSWSRRHLLDSGAESFPPPLEASDPASPRLLVGALRAQVSEDSLALAQSWQFFWRAASAPRAPSLVS